MTVRIHLETVIDAPIEVVYDLARDLDLHAASMADTGEQAIAGRLHGRIELGETVTWRARHFGIPWTLTSRIVEAEPPWRLVDEQVDGPFAWFRHEHRFDALDDGRTRMVDDWAHASPFGPLGWLADRFVLRGHLTRLLERRNAAITAAVGSGWPSRRPG
jgi:ligand-binding SRPBCC domain-containing protein